MFSSDCSLLRVLLPVPDFIVGSSLINTDSSFYDVFVSLGHRFVIAVKLGLRIVQCLPPLDFVQGDYRV